MLASQHSADLPSPQGSSPVRATHLGASPLPLVLEPLHREARSPAVLADYLAARRPWVDAKLTEHGALLFRGFSLFTPEAFEQVARAVDPDLAKDYLGTSPRNALTEYVFSASELPPFYPIPQHCEMSFLRDPPRRLFFCCLLPSTGPGGETPLCDFRRVYADLHPDVRDRFERLGVRNIRNYVGPDSGSRFDLWKLKRWDEMFLTTDRAKVEAKCRETGLDPTWLPNGGLRLVNVQPAIRRHPKTDEPVWFNHTQVFHLSAAAGEYRRIAARLGKPRYSLLAGFATAMVWLKEHTLAPEEQAMHCTYGDGSPIPDADMEHVRDAIWKNLVFPTWRRGDVVVIDNASVAHGRMPYQGPRTVAVSWA